MQSNVFEICHFLLVRSPEKLAHNQSQCYYIWFNLKGQNHQRQARNFEFAYKIS